MIAPGFSAHIIFSPTRFVSARKRHVDAQDAGLREHGVDVREVLAERGRVGIPAARVVDHAHREGVDELREAPADAPEPEDHERPLMPADFHLSSRT